ncbi:MBL fold metallo-hydrolase [Novosphingobium marinum]|uniref:Glyoxylase-like metal-dependent hydrolase (Beta-lactamase superfamily II) n=1 Tax=Novosphingobium marinum TaxID=1514948 RepID=A0A7Y9XUM9_9SPHN|nr:MBL fold metallo-hydrolase [Novosphingobium marinum]NYH94827.1 glyoxylase-like metal-dependent hydrolase (beta-lactamase superfamily II) [Novosphingobium marinum]GGC37044.1 MBL fold metallo-hydrolase [Novosphingobium marinum]
MPDDSHTGLLNWTIGDVRVTRIQESAFEGGLDAFLPFATPEALDRIEWLGEDFVTPDGVLKFSIHALVIEAAGKRIIVDTCVGNEKDRSFFPIWHRQSYRFLEILEQAGFAPGDFDVVLCTHLHLDHVGWNTMRVGDRWVPTFPNARYLMAKHEYEVFLDLIGSDSDDAMRQIDRVVFADSIEPVVDAGLVDFVAMDCEICKGVRLVPTPGHTAGHVSVMIESRGEAALITGDFVHHPCQLAHPEWSITSDYDPEQSVRTREARFADACENDALVIGTHWPTPTAGRLDRDGKVYRLR